MIKSYRKASVFFNGIFAGIIEETEGGYKFGYASNYVSNGRQLSVSLPLRLEPYESDSFFSFFEGLLPEGWYLEIVSKKFHLDKNDLFGLLIATCKDTPGAVSIEEIK
ncbi:MAG: HipA N-terminal domain-containing protein [Elusimicrobia bacterium]|nr:HipA N-terminal domain-containing protein [Elusimicrobiota bacterium]